MKKGIRTLESHKQVGSKELVFCLESENDTQMRRYFKDVCISNLPLVTQGIGLLCSKVLKDVCGSQVLQYIKWLISMCFSTTLYFRAGSAPSRKNQ